MTNKIFYGFLALIVTGETIQAQKKQPPASRNITQVPYDTMKGPQVQMGYYTLTSKEISGAVSYVPASVFSNTAAQNFQSAMQGKVAGMNVVQSNGQPGSDVLLTIRGISSIYAETQPLYIIDGVAVYAGPRERASKNVGGNWGSVFNPLSDLSPEDIESISVLKDAAATAIYGGRGGNGVVLINTKKGSRRVNNTESRVTFSQGISEMTNRVNVLNGPQYLELLDKAWINSGQTGQGPFPAASGLTRAVASATNSPQLDEALSQGQVTNFHISTGYTSDKSTFYLSGNYRSEKGVVNGNNLNRYGARMGISNQITKRLKIGITGALSYTDYKNMPTGSAPGGGFNAGQLNLPVYPLFNVNKSYFFGLDPAVYNIPGSNIPAFHNSDDYDNKEISRRVNIGLNFNYKFTQDLSFVVNADMENYFNSTANYLSKRVRNGSIGSGAGREGQPTAYNAYEKYSNNLYNVRGSLLYKKSIADHRFTAMLGGEFLYNENPYFFAEAEGYVSESSRQPANGAYRNTTTAEALIAGTNTFISYFGNVNYSFKGKYLAGVTLRRDESSKYGAAQKAFYFPAVSVGWILSDEDFLKNSSISLLKLRASYGKTGNSGIGSYSSLERWDINANSRYLLQTGIQTLALGSRSLQPESQTQFDIGLDFSIVKGRVSGAIDFYNKETNDMLLNYAAPLSAGVTQSSLLLNYGSLKNQGVELSLQTQNIMKKSFTWSTELSFAHNKNTVTNLDGLNPEAVSSYTNIATFEGHPVGVFYLPRYAGLNANGQESILDKNGNTVLATSAAQLNDARVPQYDKPSAPKFFGGVNNIFTYKKFDLNAFVTFSYGNYVLDEGERQLSYVRGNNNLRVSAYESGAPKLFYNDPISNTNTTRFLHDASYLRMKNLTIGYKFTPGKYSLKFLKNARFYLSAQNLFTVTKFPGWDPEVAGNILSTVDRNLKRGFTYLDVPQLRTFTAGINLNF